MAKLVIIFWKSFLKLDIDLVLLQLFMLAFYNEFDNKQVDAHLLVTVLPSAKWLGSTRCVYEKYVENE